MNARRQSWRPLVCLVLLVAAVSAEAAPSERLRRAIHEIPGIPLGANEVAQDATGYIWIAGSEGLARFDGVEARRWGPDVISEYLEYVSTGPAGAVCAGNPRGSLYETIGEETWRVSVPGDEPLGPVWHAAYDGNAVLWLVAGGRIYSRNPGGVWSGRDDYPLDGERPRRLTSIASGPALLGTLEGGIWRLREGRPPTRVARELGGPVSRIAVEDDGGVLALVRDRGLVRVRGGRDETLIEEASRPTGLTSRGDAIWAVFTEGVYSLRGDEVSPRLEKDQGFAGSGSVLLDRDGSLWLTSYRGVELYPEPDAVIWTQAAGYQRFRGISVIAHARGGIWAATWNGPVFRRHGELEWRALQTTGWWTAHSGCVDADGRVWVSAWPVSAEEGDRTALLRWDDGKLSIHGERPEFTHLTCDLAEDGTLWMAYGRDLMRLDAGRDRPLTVDSIPAAGSRPAALAVDAETGLAVVYGNEFCSAAGATAPWRCEAIPGTLGLTDVAAGPDGRWWVASEARRVMARENNEWLPVLPDGSLRDTRVAWLSPSPRGGLWVANPTERIRVNRIDGEIRVVEQLTRWSGVPPWWSGQVAEQPDGSIWIPTAGGLLWLPARARSNSPGVPEVRLTGVTLDGRRLAPSGSIDLPAGDHVIETRYTTLVYRNPEVVRYRVRSGNGAWTELEEPALRWVNPKAGDHAVEVQASVDGAHWSPSTVRFRFSVAPVWYARPLPWLIAAVALGALVFLAHRVRLTQLLKLERQRTAIAMDLHDEVGAAVGSIGIMAGVAAEGPASPEERAAIVSRIAAAAEEVGASLYDIIWSLRIEDARIDQLAAQLTERGSRLFPGDTTVFETVLRDGLPAVELSLPVRRNIQRIVVEALHNAARHGHAARVELGFDCRPRGWIAWVEDDGVGLDHDSGRMGGRLGIEGMRSRAREIGAYLDIGRGPLGGTRLELWFHPDGSPWKPGGRGADEHSLLSPEPGEAS